MTRETKCLNQVNHLSAPSNVSATNLDMAAACVSNPDLKNIKMLAISLLCSMAYMIDVIIYHNSWMYTSYIVPETSWTIAYIRPLFSVLAKFISIQTWETISAYIIDIHIESFSWVTILRLVVHAVAGFALTRRGLIDLFVSLGHLISLRHLWRRWINTVMTIDSYSYSVKLLASCIADDSQQYQWLLIASLGEILLAHHFMYNLYTCIDLVIDKTIAVSWVFNPLFASLVSRLLLTGAVTCATIAIVKLYRYELQRYSSLKEIHEVISTAITTQLSSEASVSCSIQSPTSSHGNIGVPPLPILNSQDPQSADIYPSKVWGNECVGFECCCMLLNYCPGEWFSTLRSQYIQGFTSQVSH